MKRQGFMFLEVLVGLAILGIVSVSCLPLLNISFRNFSRIKDNSEMYHIGEMVVEKLKTDTPHIQDIKNELEAFNTVDYIDSSFDNDKFTCQIINTGSNEKLLEFKVTVSKIHGENNSYVEYKASVPW